MISSANCSSVTTDLSSPATPSMDAARASRIFWRFAIFWTVLWIALPALIMPSPGLYDTIEQFILGREWVMGSVQHPPLPFWILETTYQLCGRSIVSGYCCGALISLLGLWVVWRLSRYYVSETLALLIVLCSACYRYFNMGNVDFTTSVPPVSLWCLSIFLMYRALKFRRNRDWVWLGISLGAGMMCKYSIGILVLTMILYLVWDRNARSLWKTPGPWLTTLVANLLFAPHLLWMIHHEFPTIRYAADSLTGSASPLSHVTSPLLFMAAQILLLLPILVPLIPLLGFAWQLKRRRPQPDDQDPGKTEPGNRFLSFMIFVPVAIQLVIFALCGGHMRSAYGSPLWTLTALWFVQFFQVRPGEKPVRWTVILASVVMACTVVSFWADYQFRYCFTKKPCRAHFPARALGLALDHFWSEKYGPLPCPILSGDWQVAGHAALYMEGRPSVLCYYNGLEEGKHPDGFWVFDEDLTRRGGIIVWKEGSGLPPNDVPEYLHRRFPTAIVYPGTLSIPWQTKADIPPLKLRYAIAPPASREFPPPTRQEKEFRAPR